MSSLIVTIIAVVLAAVLAFVTLYFGGSALTGGAARAHAATVISQGEQIITAATLYYVDKGVVPASLDVLVAENYLRNIPLPPAVINETTLASLSPISSAYAGANNWTWDAQTQTLTLPRQMANGSICGEINDVSFNSKGIIDGIDTRMHVQCYGGAQPYTVIWDANITKEGRTVNGEHSLCAAARNIGHVPAQCAEGIISGSPNPGVGGAGSVPSSTVPPPVSLLGYPNVDNPLTYLPGQPTDGWQPVGGSMCSPPKAFGSWLPAVEYVVDAPGNGALTVTFDQNLTMGASYDSATGRYNYEYYTRNYDAQVYLDDVLVAEHAVAFQDAWGDDINGQPFTVTTPSLSVTPGEHRIRIEVATALVPVTALYDYNTGTMVPVTQLPPEPTISSCVTNLQHAISVAPSVAGTSDPLPAPGEVSVTGTCTISSKAVGLDYSYLYWDGEYGLYSSLSAAYSVSAQNVVIRGTKETLDSMGSALMGIGDIWHSNGPNPYSLGYLSSIAPSAYNYSLNPGYLNATFVRVDDTTLVLSDLGTSRLYGFPWSTQGWSNYDTVMENLHQALTTPIPAEDAVLYFGGMAALTCSLVDTPVDTANATTFCPSGYNWDPAQTKCVCVSGSCSTAPVAAPTLSASATSTNPSCPAGYSYSTAANQCLCQATGTSVCAPAKASSTFNSAVTPSTPRPKVWPWAPYS